MEQTTYGVFVSGVAGSVGEFRERLVAQGMSQERAAQVATSMPCFVKRDVPLAVAQQFKQVFERAGAWVVIENWQTTQNPAACDAFVARPADEPAFEFAVAVGTGTGGTVAEPAAAAEQSAAPVDGAADAEDAGVAAAAAEVEARRRRATTPVKFRPVELPPRDPVKAWTPAAIALAILGVFASYVYGCAHVMSKQSDFKERVTDIGVALENYNARGFAVTPSVIVEEVQAIGSELGVDIDEDDVQITPERIRVRPNGLGGCSVDYMPDTVRHLPAWERDNILRNLRTCDVPRWIVGIRVTTRIRWGLYSDRLELERFAPVLEYSEADDDV